MAIWVMASGAVMLIDHNNGNQVVHLADSFLAFIESNVDQ